MEIMSQHEVDRFLTSHGFNPDVITSDYINTPPEDVDKVEGNVKEGIFFFFLILLFVFCFLLKRFLI